MDPVDWKGLRAGCADDDSLVAEIVALFLRDAPVLLAEVKRALEAGDSVAVHRAAHKLKGALATMYAVPAQAAASKVEVASAAKDLAKSSAGWSELEVEVLRAIDELTRRTGVR